MSWVLQLTLLLALQSGSDLNQVVHDYWTALAARDKVRAMEFVHPEDLNKFLNRHEPPIKDWKLERIEQPSELEASVTVTFVRPSPTGVLFLARAREVWQKLDSGWRVRIQSLEDYRRQLDQAQRTKSELPPSLDVLPREMRFYKGSNQPGVIVIRNGLAMHIEVVGLEFDKTRLEVTKLLREVASRSTERMALRYRGEASEQNSKSRILLKLKVSGELREFVIPVVFNFDDPLMERLKRLKPKK